MEKENREVPFSGTVLFLTALGEDVIALFGAVFAFLLRFIGMPIKKAVCKIGALVCKIGKAVYADFIEQVGSERYFTGRAWRAIKAVFHACFKAPATLPAVVSYYLRRAMAQYKNVAHYLALVGLPIFSFLVMLGVIFHFADIRVALRIEANGVSLGYVASENNYLQARNQAKAKVTLASENTSAVLPTVTYTICVIDVNQYTDTDTLCLNLIKNADCLTANACGIYIDGEFLCAVINESTAKRALNTVLQSFEEQYEDAILSFEQDIELVEGLYPDTADVIWNEQRLLQALSLKQQEGTLVVQVAKTETYNEDTSYGVREIPSDALYAGAKRIVVNGADGVDQVTAVVTYVNGEKTGVSEINRLTLKEPVNECIQIGTKTPDGDYFASSYGGLLMWPTVGANNINSPYGYRWGKIHTAIDIGSAQGTSLGKLVVAAAEGTVVLAGVHSSYGYYVKIDHGGGMQTLYAHCQANSIMVNVGDKVNAGQAIARIGQTGYATGPHLHFEVIINGEKVNPAPYLGLK